MLTETPQFPYYQPTQPNPKKPASIPLKHPVVVHSPALSRMFPPSSRSLDLRRASSDCQQEKEEEKMFKYLYLKQKFVYQQILKKHGINVEVDDSSLRDLVYGK